MCAAEGLAAWRADWSFARRRKRDGIDFGPSRVRAHPVWFSISSHCARSPASAWMASSVPISARGPAGHPPCCLSRALRRAGTSAEFHECHSHRMALARFRQPGWSPAARFGSSCLAGSPKRRRCRARVFSLVVPPSPSAGTALSSSAKPGGQSGAAVRTSWEGDCEERRGPEKWEKGDKKVCAKGCCMHSDQCCASKCSGPMYTVRRGVGRGRAECLFHVEPSWC